MSSRNYQEIQGIEGQWFGSVPAHWSAPSCRAIVSERTDKNDDGSCTDYLSLMANTGVIPYEEKGDIGNKKPEDLTKCKIVFPGDFVINSMNYYIGSYGVSSYKGVCSPVYIVLRHNDLVVDSGFAFRIFESREFQEYAQSFGNGILEHRRSINWSILKSIKVPLPPLSEQRSIAAFLDAETSKIDALVAEQRRLIELLKEKRQAVISHAVTKGLNPHVKMKPSGIDWLGDVPEHWEVLRAKNVSDIFVPQRNKPDLNEQRIGLPWITMEQMKQHYITDSALFVSELASKESGSRALRANSVIASCVGQFGIAAVNTCEVIINQQLQAYIPTPRINSDFFKFLIEVSTAYFERVSTSATLSYVNQKGFERLPLAIPDTQEQIQIVECLKERLNLVDSQIMTVEQAICLLQERRNALISAAVTGKIDVRGFVPKEASA